MQSLVNKVSPGIMMKNHPDEMSFKNNRFFEFCLLSDSVEDLWALWISQTMKNHS